MRLWVTALCLRLSLKLSPPNPIRALLPNLSLPRRRRTQLHLRWRRRRDWPHRRCRRRRGWLRRG